MGRPRLSIAGIAAADGKLTTRLVMIAGKGPFDFLRLSCGGKLALVKFAGEYEWVPVPNDGEVTPYNGPVAKVKGK